MGYQAFVLWVGLSIVLIGMLAFILPILFIPANSTASALDLNSLMDQASPIQTGMTWAWFLLCLPGLVGAGFALVGREFFYPFFGRRLESRLSSNRGEFDETREDDWVAGICHSSAAVIFWGMILPWAIYSTQKDRSPRLRFQSLQAFLFQLLAVFAFGFAFVFLGCMMLSVIWLSQYMNSAAGAESNPGLYLIIVVLAMLIFAVILLLSLPTFHLFAFIAWVRVARGQDYLYPIVGKRLKRRFGQ